MCGIAGTIGNAWSDSDFQTLFEAIRHRGPDASGYVIRGSTRLGMHRLKLRGAQCTIPVKTSRSIASFNGQIYAMRFGDQVKRPTGLQEEVESLESSVQSVDGMFACGMLDLSSDEVSLLSDPFFIKPLFFRTQDESTAVCSELAPLVNMRANTIDFDALADLFSFGWTISDATWITGIQMAARSNIRIDHSDVHYRPKPKPLRYAANIPSLEEIRSAVSRSVRACVSGTGPFGLAISGGLDSSILAWELNEAGIEHLVTISIQLSSDDDGIDSLAELGFPPGGAWTTWKHRNIRVSKQEFLQDLTKSIIAFGQPTTMSSLPLSQRLADVAREEGVRVLITGEGADELFAGYSSYGKLTPHAPALGYYSNPRRENVVRTLFGREAWQAGQERFRQKYSSYSDLRDIEIEMRLARLLLRTDVTFMSQGIEGRPAFLHSGIPSLALSVPWDIARSNGGKHILRMAYSSQLGSRASRPKTRFRLTDNDVHDILRKESFTSVIETQLSKLFGVSATNDMLSTLLTAGGFDADSAFLCLSLAVLLESGVGL